jgi:hypothetical protein
MCEDVIHKKTKVSESLVYLDFDGDAKCPQNLDSM